MMFSRRRTWREVRADQLAPGMVLLSHGNVVARFGGERIRKVGLDSGNGAILVTGANPRWAWSFLPHEVIRIAT